MSDKNLNIDIKKEILDAIEIMVNNAIKRLPYDITRQVRVTNVSNGIVTIMLDGKKYEVKSNISCKVNDTVDALIKQNDMNNITLLPKSSSSSVHISSKEPTASDGNNGDIWIVYSDE